MLLRFSLRANSTLSIVLFALSGCAASHATNEAALISSVEDLHWLAGHWVQQSADGSTTNEELWLAPAGGMMLGVNRTLEDGRAVFFEFLMIRELNGSIAYLAMPGGQSPPTVFPMTRGSDWSIVFENPGHDFPQRIHYQRESDSLTAVLSGGNEGEIRTETWRWRRAD